MHELVQYKDFIFYKIGADLRSESRRYYISYVWWFLDPVFYMLVFYFIFGVLFERNRPDFVPFLLVGLASWRWFASSVQHAGQSIMQSKGLMMQIYIPKIVFPIIVIFSDTFKFFMIFMVLIIYLWVYGFEINVNYCILPLVITSQMVIIIFAGLMVSAICPFIPDIKFFIDHLIQLLFFVSGIFFGIETIPEKYHTLFLLNPMARIIQSYREILMYNTLPNVKMLIMMLGISLCGCYISSILLRKYDKIYPRIVE